MVEWCRFFRIKFRMLVNEGQVMLYDAVSKFCPQRDLPSREVFDAAE